MKRFVSTASLIQTAAALLLMALCLIASQWQFQRGQIQREQSALISRNAATLEVPIADLSPVEPIAMQWRNVSLRGKFDAAHQELIRNRYSEGRYGFEVLQLFTTESGDRFWVDRGWVSAGADARTPPNIPTMKSDTVRISARIRSENLSHQLQGSFFATSARKNLPNLSNLQGVSAANYYLDLLSSNSPAIQPLTKISLPALTNGPHYAYAVQWLAFSVLILIGRIALFREFKQ